MLSFNLQSRPGQQVTTGLPSTFVAHLTRAPCLNYNPLDLIKAELVAEAIVELRRAVILIAHLARLRGTHRHDSSHEALSGRQRQE
jgi:hypothetical protein